MFDALTQTRIRARQYEALGLELPDDVTRLVAIVQTAVDAARHDPVTDLDYDALTVKNVAGKLREAALTRAVRDGMQQIAGEIGIALWGPISRALAADVDRVTEELRPGFLEAASTVTEAIAAGLTVDTYGNADRVIAAGPEATGLFHRTKQALAHLSAVRSFLFTEGTTTAAAFVDLTEQADVGTLDRAEWFFSGLGGDEKWLNVYAVPGVCPALNTAAEAQAVARRSASLGQARVDAQHAAAVKAAQEREAGWLYVHSNEALSA